MKRITQKILSYIRLAYIIIKYGKKKVKTKKRKIFYKIPDEYYSPDNDYSK